MFSVTGIQESFPFSLGVELELERNYYCMQQIVKVITQRSTVRRKKVSFKKYKKHRKYVQRKKKRGIIAVVKESSCFKVAFRNWSSKLTAPVFAAVNI